MAVKVPQENQKSLAALKGWSCTPSTGLPDLDRVLQGIRPGDNIVWRVDSIEHYAVFAQAAIHHATRCGVRAAYFKFHGSATPALDDSLPPEVTTHTVHPDRGFEYFITQIHGVIRANNKGCLYIFDSLSELSSSTYSDRMIGNFFSLTCPLLHSLGAVAYFALFRYFHSYHAASPIAETTQLLLDVYHHFGTYFMQPVKAENRSSPTLFMMHKWQNDQFLPVGESDIISEVVTAQPWPGLPSTSYRMIGVWDKTFVLAEATQQEVEAGTCTAERYNAIFRRLIDLMISRDSRIVALAAKYFTLKDIIQIWKRMIGTGMIGGKSVGMLLARAILRSDGPHWLNLLEKHDSFFIGSDVFYTFLVQNGCWWARQRQKDPRRFLKGNDAVRRKILKGHFPEYIVPRLRDMLDYFGPFPIIVRSSSLMEDNFGNAFAGKYESVFCTNQGTKAERLEELMHAVRMVYASTMSEGALTYRKSRGVLDSDEQMALLVQRVSGRPYSRHLAFVGGGYYFPQLAGVGFSLNPYRWHRDIDPEAGMIRLVFGLGTRAVDRSDDDYTRVVALNEPERQPHPTKDDLRRYAQHRVDVLDLAVQKLVTVEFGSLVDDIEHLQADLFSERDLELERRARQLSEATGGESNSSSVYRLLTFDRVLRETELCSAIERMMKVLRAAYRTHVDIEFTVNFSENGDFRINLVQCRPLQVQVGGQQLAPLPEISQRDLVFKAHGAVIGHSRMVEVDAAILVVPEVYGLMSERDRYGVARLIGSLLHHPSLLGKRIVLIGPGRWGTSTPSLGVPVTFAEIGNVSVLCEIDAMHEGLSPDLSLGTHFFNEMVEANMLYVAYFGADSRNLFRFDFFSKSRNVFADIFPDSPYAAAVQVVLAPLRGNKAHLYLNGDSVEQVAALYIGR